MELVLQKATELGVAEIWPVVTDRTDAAARPALARHARGALGARRLRRGRAVRPGGRATASPTRRPSGPCWRSRSTGRGSSCWRRPAIPRCQRSRTRRRRPLLLLVGPAGGFEPLGSAICSGPQASTPRRSAPGSCARRRRRSPQSRSLRRPGAICASTPAIGPRGRLECVGLGEEARPAAPDRKVRDPPRARPRRDGRRVPGVGHHPRSDDRLEDDQAGGRLGRAARGLGEAVPDRGAGRRATLPSRDRRRVRRRPRSRHRRPLHRARVSRGTEPGAEERTRPAAPVAGGPAHRRPGRRGPPPRPHSGRHPPRHQARERHGRALGRREDPRLRRRTPGRGLAHEPRRPLRHSALHVPRAGLRSPARRPIRHLLPGGGGLDAAHRADPFRRPEPLGDPAARDAPIPASAFRAGARDPEAGRRDPGARDGQDARGPLPGRPAARRGYRGRPRRPHAPSSRRVEPSPDGRADARFTRRTRRAPARASLRSGRSASDLRKPEGAKMGSRRAPARSRWPRLPRISS